MASGVIIIPISSGKKTKTKIIVKIYNWKSRDFDPPTAVHAILNIIIYS